MTNLFTTTNIKRPLTAPAGHQLSTNKNTKLLPSLSWLYRSALDVAVLTHKTIIINLFQLTNSQLY